MTPVDLMCKKVAQNEGSMNPHTFAAYNRYWQDFITFVDDEYIQDFADLSIAHVTKFIKQRCGTKAASFKQAKAAIIHLLSDLVDDGIDIPVLPVIGASKALKVRKNVTKPKVFLTKDELAKCREAIADLYAYTPAIARRNELIWTLLEQTLIRVDELLQIRLVDIDLDGKRLAVRGKGALSEASGNRAVSAYIPLKTKTINMLVRYVTHFRKPLKAEKQNGSKVYLEHPATYTADTPLFTGARGQLGKRAVYNIVHDTIQSVLGYPSCGPHTIRRSVATIMYRETKDIWGVSRMLRHANIETTQKYLGISQDELDAMFNQMNEGE